MAVKTAKQIADKWERGANAASQAMEEGVKAVIVAPSVNAIKALPKTKANFIKSIDNGKMKAGLERIDLKTWQDSMIDKGIPRFAEGVRQAKNKYMHFAEQQVTYNAETAKQLEAMPKLTLADSKARMLANFERQIKFKPTKI